MNNCKSITLKALTILLFIIVSDSSIILTQPCVWSCSLELDKYLESCNAAQCTQEYIGKVQSAKTGSERDALLVEYQSCLMNGTCDNQSDLDRLFGSL